MTGIVLSPIELILGARWYYEPHLCHCATSCSILAEALAFYYKTVQPHVIAFAEAPDKTTLTELDKLAEEAATLRVGLVLGLGNGQAGRRRLR